ncbi:helix-turn-helix domain-containing protein [Chryseobacterium echinoideorum]|uniref:helix-turn-helix domain-containing protein n=1 Tax=Chryseobacterium echinoideorum TaxID=1549648 RepID=UPI0011850A96|nr:helix-turn-helix transcriptional regulator [Chryseobacterium echinoideorum]
MMLFISLSKAHQKLVENIRERRLQMDLTQEGLAERCGVPLSTLRKFEQTGMVSLESFLKILSIVGGLEEMIEGLKPITPAFKSIGEVLKSDEKSVKKRGSKK